MIGYNLFERLDLSQCQKVGSARIYPSTVGTQDVLETQIQLPSGVERYTPWYANKRISELSNFDVPDERLLACIHASAAAEKAIYTYQLKNLTCRGSDDKSYAQAFVSRQDGRADTHTKSYVFDITGLELLSNLEAIDLSVNWISSLYITSLTHVKTLKLDGNIIQQADLISMESLTQLSLNSNPLHRLMLPARLEKLTASGGIAANHFVGDILGKYNLAILREGGDGELLTAASFAQKYVIGNIEQAFSLIDVQPDRVEWPAAVISFAWGMPEARIANADDSK